MNNNKLAIGVFCMGFAMVIFLAWQVVMAFQVNGNLSNASKNVTPVVGQAELAQKNLESFVVDLMQLAEHNEGAKAIVDKYQIKRSDANN